MNKPDRTPPQAERLLALVDEYREVECGARLQRAREQATQLMREARTAARRRVHHAVGETRNAGYAEIGAVRARLETRRRLRLHETRRALLTEAWTLLPAALQRRWADAAARREWVDAALAYAARALPTEPWRIEHPPGWPPEEARAALEALRGTGGRDAFLEDPALAAGLRIRCGTAVVDASRDRLLGDRTGIEAQLLARLGAGADGATGSQRAPEPEDGS